MLSDYDNPRRIVFKTKPNRSNACGRPFPVKGGLGLYTAVVNGTHCLPQPVEPRPVSVKVLATCPECGGYLARAGYCFSCMTCGWGACGG